VPESTPEPVAEPEPEPVDTTVADNIRQQIRSMDPQAFTAWGAHEFVAGPNYLQFKVNGSKHRGLLKVELTPKDLYDVKAYAVRGPEVKVRQEYKDVFVENLVEVLDDLIG
jgi:hypothetical protein